MIRKGIQMQLTVTQIIIAALAAIIAIALGAFGGFYAATMSFRTKMEQLNREMTEFATIVKEKLEPRLENNLARLDQLQKENQTTKTNLKQLSKDLDTLSRKNDIAREAKTYVDLRLEEIRKESMETIKGIMDRFYSTSTNNQPTH